MIDTASQWVQANAYISRHRLTWQRIAAPITKGKSDLMFFFMVEDPNDWHFKGYGDSLYEAVLDYQEASGKGWGSS